MNILALPSMQETYRVIYDSGPGDDGDMFVVHTMRGPLRFGASSEGLYYATAASLVVLSHTPVTSQGRPLVESTRMAATRMQTDKSTSARLAAFHWRADKGWDPNEVFLKHIAAVPNETLARTVAASSLGGVAQGALRRPLLVLTETG